jgi:glycosyltransferase involved in cell wall biosynthesis
MSKSPAIGLSVLIPTYNEADIIEDTLKAVAAALGDALARKTEVLVVDDGTDRLPDIVAKAREHLPLAAIEVLRNSPPLGKGRSLARGFEKARGEIAGFLDADLSTPPSYIKTAYDALKHDKADLFVGSRKALDSRVERKQSAAKDVLGNLLSLGVNAVIFSGGQKFRDTQCGFKFFKSEVAKTLYRDLVAGDGMTDIEVLVRANMLGLRVLERGVDWHDTRESKRRLSRILAGDLKALAAIIYHYRIFGGEQLRKLRKAA